MEVPESIVKAILEILDSHISAYGEDYGKVFELNDNLKQVYRTLKPKETIEEAKPNSTLERIRRVVRKTPKVTRRFMKGQTVPKTNSTEKAAKRRNNPGRGGNRSHLHQKTKEELIPEDLQEVMKFVKENISKKGQALEVAISGFEHKDLLHKFVSHMIATSIGGWQMKDGILVNESGHTASPDKWRLNKHGKLISKNAKNPVDIKIEWFLKVRECING